jgi:hypothetical protein
LESVRRRLDHWRRTRVHARAPLPDRLWRAAAALVPEHGVYGTARALGISYGGLKRHVRPGEGARDERGGVRFVELPPAVVADPYVIEIEGAGRPTVRVRLPGVSLAELAAFTRGVAGASS